MDDTRWYGMPLQSDFSASRRAYLSGLDSDPSNVNSYEQYYSAGDPGSPGSEDMHRWIRYPKPSAKQSRKSKNSANARDKHRESPAIPRNQNPGIDAALRNLRHEIGASIGVFQAIVQSFEADTEPLQGWAEQDTLDAVWRNKVKDKCREKRDRQRFEGAMGRFASAKASVKEAVRRAKGLKETWDDKHDIERQIRTAKKMLPYCEGIIDLAGRAANERVACKELVLELVELQTVLDGKRHAWIYGQDMTDREVGDIRKPTGSRTSPRRGSRQPTDEAENLENEGDGEQAEPCELVDEAPEQWEEDGGDW